MDGIELHCMDAMAVLPGIPTGSVDLVIADPPYNVGIDYDGYSDDLSRRDYLAWCAGWFAQCFRITRRFLIIFPGLPNEGDWWHFSPARGVWHKPGNPAGGGPFRWNESEVWYLWTKNKAWCGYSDTITAPLPSHGQKDTGDFPCPKPPKLYAEILKRFKPASVLDPFMGSGTMGVQCAKESIVFTGVELSEKYFSLAKGRILLAAGESPIQLTRRDLFDDVLPTAPLSGTEMDRVVSAEPLVEVP